MEKLLIGALLLALLAGCAAAPTKEQEGAPVEDRKPAIAADQPPAKPAEKQAEKPALVKPFVEKPVAVSPLKDPANILSKRSIYFDYDSNLVKDEYKPIVTAHAQYLRQNPSARVRIEGHADERGSREYNLALGQRRAEAVKQMMQLLGVQAAQIETVSFGEEKPRCTEQAESCWWQNRRGDIVYHGE
jgi:peptidoglycan-associated lipoprotein